MLQEQTHSDSHLPFSPVVQALCPHPGRLLQKLIVENGLRTGLDIGCGSDSLLTPARSDRFQSTGIDIFPGSIEIGRRRNQHDHYICGDFRSMEFESKFDVVVLNHVIEHFDRDVGLEVLRRIESLATRIVYIGTPNGFIEQTGYGGNPFQRHLSGWFPHDFASRGYTVFGTGPKITRGVEAKPRFFPEPVTQALERSCKWYYYRRPEKSFAIAAIKYTDESDNVRQL